MEALKSSLPEHARDLKLNLASLASETVLDDEKKAGTFIASAIASRNGEVIRAMLDEFGPRMQPAARSTRSCAAMHFPQPFTADTASDHSSKFSFDVPGFAMTFMRSLAGSRA